MGQIKLYKTLEHPKEKISRSSRQENDCPLFECDRNEAVFNLRGHVRRKSVRCERLRQMYRKFSTMSFHFFTVFLMLVLFKLGRSNAPSQRQWDCRLAPMDSMYTDSSRAGHNLVTWRTKKAFNRNPRVGLMSRGRETHLVHRLRRRTRQ